MFARNGIEAKFVYLAGDAVPAALVTGGIQATPLIETVMHANTAAIRVLEIIFI